MYTYLIEILLWRTLAIFLLFGALLGVVLSLLLIFKPPLLENLNRVANRWVFVRDINYYLDRSISIERWFYRHHRPMGLLIVLGAGYILVYFGWLLDWPRALQLLSRYVPVILLETVVDIFLLNGVLALVTGFIVWLRPSLLRTVEKIANRWLTTRRLTLQLDAPHGQVDDFVLRHARRAGWSLLLGSLYLGFLLFRLLL